MLGNNIEFAHPILKIPKFNSNCNFWMVRTNNGEFFDEFITNQFIAIGWNFILKSQFPLTTTQTINVKSVLENKGTYNSKASTTIINKCYRFCCELKAGDIAVITGKERIAFAIIGEYYEEKPYQYSMDYELWYNQNSTEIQKCPYCKRRKIDIICILDNRDNINPYLYKALVLNKHSLSCLNKYADVILSSCFDAYLWSDKLTLSFRVERRKNISAVSLSQFISNFSELLPNVNKNNIAVKTALHSPGDLIFQISQWSPEDFLWVFVIWMFIFGGKIGNTEFPSLWNVIKYFIEKYENKNIKQLQEENLRLSNEKLREEIRSLELDNQRKETIENAVVGISNSAKELEIKKPRGKIINFTEVKEEIFYDQND